MKEFLYKIHNLLSENHIGLKPFLQGPLLSCVIKEHVNLPSLLLYNKRICKVTFSSRNKTGITENVQ